MTRCAAVLFNCSMAKNRYYVHDQNATVATHLANWSTMNPRFSVVDRETNQIVDSASSRYEARQTADLWNAGILPTEATS